MKVSLNWLTDYVDISMPAAELAELMTAIGLNVDAIIETPTDIVLDVEVTSNRPDCLGHLGIAREIAAATGAAFHPPKIESLPTTGRVEELTSVQVEAPELCPRYTARLIRGVKVAPSPAWLVERLEAMGLRSINNVVDVTNYVLMEYSQPLHSFDFQKLLGRRIVVRRARQGELLVSIDQSKCTLDPSMLIIADAERPVAIAGVMGGLNTEVGPETTDVLLESAQFDPLAIRRTSRKMGMMTESNYRFERGVDPVGVEIASRRACQLIIQLGGGQLAEGICDVWAEPYSPPEVPLRSKRCCALLGIEISPQRQVELLGRLGLSPRVSDSGQEILCTIPSHRGDLRREADLIEEIARLEGYEKIPVHQEVTHKIIPEARPQRLRRRIGQVLSAAGLDEAITFTFIDPPEAELFGFEKTVRVDPLTRRTNNVLRPTLLPSLLSACKRNQDAGNADVRLYELAAVFPGADGDNGLPSEHLELAMTGACDLRDLRGVLEALVSGINPQAEMVVVEQGSAGLADPAGEVLLNGVSAGRIGLIAANVLDYYGLKRPFAAATVRFEALLDIFQETRQYRPLPRFPSIQRDLSLIVDEPVTWLELQEAIAGVDQPMRRAIDYVTTYRGKPIPAGRKSITLRLTYRRDDGTLLSEEADEQVEEVLAVLKERFSAELRA